MPTLKCYRCWSRRATTPSGLCRQCDEEDNMADRDHKTNLEDLKASVDRLTSLVEDLERQVRDMAPRPVTESESLFSRLVARQVREQEADRRRMADRIEDLEDAEYRRRHP